MTNRLCFSLVILATCCVSVTTSNAAVMGYNFSQDGFDEGAIVTGMFTVDDLNGDGQSSSFLGEVLSFMMDFSGNSIVPAFSANFPDLFGLVYDLNDGPILGDGITGNVEGLGVTTSSTPIVWTYTAGSGPGPFPGGQISGGGVATSTRNNIVVTPKVPAVPEPSSVLKWGGALLTPQAFDADERHDHSDCCYC